jgi:hypothetical protein
MEHAAQTSKAPVQPSPASAGRHHATKREIVLAVVAALALAAAVWGFALYSTALVPATAAARVNDSYLDEGRVASRIAQYRSAYHLEDDADFASALLAQNLNVDTFRQSTINQLVLSDLIDQRAEELGVVFTDEDAQAQVDAMKRSLAFDDDEVWAETLAGYGMSADSLRLQYLANLKQQAVCEADIARRAPTDAEVLAYTQTYLATTTQKHASRILFTGDDALARTQECYELLLAAKGEDEGISAEAFAAMAREYSDEEGVGATGGACAWSGSVVLSEDVTTLLESLAIGSFSAPQSAEADGALEIIYCDEEYAFPATDAIVLHDVPASLRELIEAATADALWSLDRDAYLAALLMDAQVTYYPIPKDAAYAVSMALASSW